MRTALGLLLLLAVSVGRAQDNFPVLLDEHVDVRSHQHTKFYTDRKSLADSPDWTPLQAGPPLAIADATKVAIDAGKHRFANAQDIFIERVSLQQKILEASTRNPEKMVRWFYVFSVNPITEGRHFGDLTPIVILLDGKVIEPVVSE
jgi:hypothetical protein